MDIKKCYRCSEEKDFSFFNKCKHGTHGLHGHCKQCQKIVRHEWYIKNQEKEKEKSKNYSKTTISKKQQKNYYNKNRDKILERNRTRRRTPRARNLANLARNQKYNNNINFRISVTTRARINKALKRSFAVKSNKSSNLLGCSIEELKIHLESLFTEGMSWLNYGYYGWHIDHIMPCSKFNLLCPKEQRKCFHYTNLQPLWMKDNISKCNKITS